MKNHFKFIIGMLSVSALLFAGMNTALADKKVYPGSMAVKTSSSGTLVYSRSAVGTSSDSSVHVYLPVINDVMGSTISSSYVKVLDRSDSYNHRCSINSVYWNETYDTWYGSWGPNLYSSGSGDNLQTLNTGSIGGSSGRHEYFSCRIPPINVDSRHDSKTSYIVQYAVTEG